MNKTEKSPRMRRAVARSCEKGFTLMEILVALAIIGIIVAVTAAALGGRATTTRLESVASQVAQTVQGRQQLYVNELRDAHLTTAELANELATVFANSTIVDGGTTVAVASGTVACDTTAGVGVAIGLDANVLSTEEANTLQTQIQSAVANIFDGIGSADDGGYSDVFNGTGQPIATTTTGPRAAPTITANPPTLVHLCIGS